MLGRSDFTTCKCGDNVCLVNKSRLTTYKCNEICMFVMHNKTTRWVPSVLEFRTSLGSGCSNIKILHHDHFVQIHLWRLWKQLLLKCVESVPKESHWLPVRAPYPSVSWTWHLTQLACWWWSEGLVVPCGCLASVRPSQGSSGCNPVPCHQPCVNGNRV